ncbi:hypothetical protein ACIRRH_39375 [Kitasatospora sp. NPDC101235]|uniref:hypothetical protein n=1 Tax=Kitasatospora sp. NPDC101235 TaxID=3364101 RepID=UPI0037FE24C5
MSTTATRIQTTNTSQPTKRPRGIPTHIQAQNIPPTERAGRPGPTITPATTHSLGCTPLWPGDRPVTALNWLRNSRSAALLTRAVAAGRALTHEDLDGLAAAEGRDGARVVDHLRSVLLAQQALPERDELPARVERHLVRVLVRHPEHALLLRAYVRWSLLPRPDPVALDDDSHWEIWGSARGGQAG